MKTKAITGILGLFVIMPIWFYLLYIMLSGVDAGSVAWFLYWVYLPVSLLVNILTKLAE